MSRLGQWLAALTLGILVTGGLGGAYVYTHRFQITADHRMLYVVDQWEGRIDVYSVGDRKEHLMDLTVHHIASSGGDD